MKRNIKINIESHEYDWFVHLLGEAAKSKPWILEQGLLSHWRMEQLPAKIMAEWFGGRFVRIMQTRGWAHQRNKKWPEKFSEAEATAFMIRLEELALPVESPANLIRNNLIDQLHRQILSN